MRKGLRKQPWILASSGLAVFLLGSEDAIAERACWTMGPAQYAEGIEYCVSSILKPHGDLEYGPHGIADGKESTAWCEGVPGNGKGQWIEMRIDRGSSFRRLLIQNGYGKTAKTYRNNGRLKTVGISVDGSAARTVELTDTHDIAPIELPNVGLYRHVRITILDVYPGEKYSDTCVDYVSPDFEYEENTAPQQSQPAPSPEREAAPAPPSALEPADSLGDLGMPDDDDLRLKPR